MSLLPNPEEALVGAALAIPELDKREVFLRGACQGDEALYQRVVQLIQQRAASAKPPTVSRPGTTLSGRPGEHSAETERVGLKVGSYRLVELLGEGSFGAVYLAEQSEPVKRQVALKIIKLGMDSREVVARFGLERQALAMMDHPNIAKVLDAGTSITGRPYFVMELVRGERLTKYCDENNLALEDRLQLFIEVCHAIQHAHQKGIIHRDIKPSNILVPVHDGKPVPKVIDFGIAKATANPRQTGWSLATSCEQLVGTPAYMSPEQTDMVIRDVDTRSDIYGLGALLYELLTGQPPFEAQELDTIGFDEMRRRIREVDPPRPSQKLWEMAPGEMSYVVAHRRTNPESLIAEVRGDLDWIVMKALEKDRARRYPTANGLAADVQHYLNHEPVSACPPAIGYVLSKLVQRHQTAFAFAAAITATLILGIVMSSWQAVRATNAEREQARLRRVAESARANEAKHRAKAEEASAQAEQEELAARRIAYDSDLSLACQSLRIGNANRALLLLRRHLPKPGKPDLRDWEWHYLWDRCQSKAAFELSAQSNSVLSLTVSPDGKWLALANIDGRINILDRASNTTVSELPDHLGYNRGTTFSPSGKWLVYPARRLSGDASRRYIRLWDTANRRPQGEYELPGGVQRICGVAFDPDETRMFVLQAQECLVFDLETKKLVRRERAQAGFSAHFGALAVSADGKHFAIGEDHGWLRVQSTASYQTNFTRRVFDEAVTALAFSPDGSTLAAGSGFNGGAVRLIDTATGRETGRLSGHAAWISTLTFTKDGNRLISTSADQTARIWDVAAQREVASLIGHTAEVYSAALTPDGHTLLTGGKDGSLLGWDLDELHERKDYETLAKRVSAIDSTADGKHLISINQDGTVSLWDAETSKESGQFTNVSNATSLLTLSDGRHAAVAARQGAVSIVNIVTGRQTATFQPGTNVCIVAGTVADGKHLVTCDGDGWIRRWDTTTWEMAGEVRAADFGTITPLSSMGIALSASGILVRVQGRAVNWWRVTDGVKLGGVREPHARTTSGLACSADGRWVATSSSADVARLWDTQTGKMTGELAGHLLGPHQVTFSRDAKRLATGSAGQDTIKLWDSVTLQEVATLSGDGLPMERLRFLADGVTLSGIDRGGKAYLWRATLVVARKEPAEPGEATASH